MIYGANGYTAKLISEHVKSLGHSPILAGRNKKAVEALADQLGFDSVIFDLSDRKALERALSDVQLVFHGAGPFTETSAPMVDGCLSQGTHYIDITGELDVFEACVARSKAATSAGVMLMPGCGFDVVPTDCLASYAGGKVTSPAHLALGIFGNDTMSRGTAKTGATMVGKKTKVRRDGKIVKLKKPLRRAFEFGDGPVDAIAVSWGDVSTAYHSTGIPDIDIYLEATEQIESFSKIPSFLGPFLRLPVVQSVIRSRIDKMAAGPSDEERAAGGCTLIAEVTNRDGDVFRAKLTTPESYTLTVLAVSKIIENILAGRFQPGFQTPSLVYGSDFVLQFDGVRLEDLN